jgi:hypothetical protein
LFVNEREAIPMSAFPFITSSMAWPDPPVCTSICTPGCRVEKRLPAAAIIGAIVFEPVTSSLPKAGAVPFAERFSTA